MSMDCARCSALVGQAGDHLCGACAEALGRNPSQPFWGDFANHPDATLRIIPAVGEIERARDFVGVIDGMLAAPPWPKPRWSNPSQLTDEFKAFERRSAR
jgi:hypothetical protein